MRFPSRKLVKKVLVPLAIVSAIAGLVTTHLWLVGVAFAFYALDIANEGEFSHRKVGKITRAQNPLVFWYVVVAWLIISVLFIILTAR